jgi:hypothetical protein
MELIEKAVVPPKFNERAAPFCVIKMVPGPPLKTRLSLALGVPTGDQFSGFSNVVSPDPPVQVLTCAPTVDGHSQTGGQRENRPCRN